MNGERLDKLEAILQNLDKEDLFEGGDADEASLKPLDPEGVERERRILFGAEAEALLNRWREVPPNPASEFEEPWVEWRESLDRDRVAAYLAAAAAPMRSLLLDAGGGGEAQGQIYHLGKAPFFQTFARPDSVLASERDLPDAEGGDVRLESAELGQSIALSCSEPPIWGEIAWRLLAPSLSDCQNVLPRLEAHYIDDGLIEDRYVRVSLMDTEW